MTAGDDRQHVVLPLMRQQVQDGFRQPKFQYQTKILLSIRHLTDHGSGPDEHIYSVTQSQNEWQPHQQREPEHPMARGFKKKNINISFYEGEKHGSSSICRRSAAR
jgi:hypothetical protein